MSLKGLEAEAANPVAFACLHQEPDMRRLAVHNCVSYNDFRDAELLSRGDILLESLADSALGSRTIIQCEEELASLGILHKVKLCGVIPTDEFNDVLPGVDGNVSHTFCSLNLQ